MNRYTFFIEFEDGTYIRQESSLNMKDAVVKCFSNLDFFAFLNFEENQLKDVLSILIEEDIVKVDEVEDVYCLGAFLREDSFVSIHIVIT